MAFVDPFLAELRQAQRIGRQVIAAAAARGEAGGSGHRRGVEQHQRVVQLPVFGPGLLAAAGHFEHQAE